jgi:hypothetical protein
MTEEAPECLVDVSIEYTAVPEVTFHESRPSSKPEFDRMFVCAKTPGISAINIEKEKIARTECTIIFFIASLHSLPGVVSLIEFKSIYLRKMKLSD